MPRACQNLSANTFPPSRKVQILRDWRMRAGRQEEDEAKHRQRFGASDAG